MADGSGLSALTLDRSAISFTDRKSATNAFTALGMRGLDNGDAFVVHTSIINRNGNIGGGKSLLGVDKDDTNGRMLTVHGRNDRTAAKGRILAIMGAASNTTSFDTSSRIRLKKCLCSIHGGNAG